MFGSQQIEHDRRYEMAGEFTDMLCRLWGASDDLTLQGEFWSLEKAFIHRSRGLGARFLERTCCPPQYNDRLFPSCRNPQYCYTQKTDARPAALRTCVKSAANNLQLEGRSNMAQPAGLDNVVLIDSGHEPRDRRRGQSRT